MLFNAIDAIDIVLMHFLFFFIFFYITEKRFMVFGSFKTLLELH